ncbi:hypothetical protein ASD92_17890 [Massilia sp. Root1485]|nr:hypothetical protein ASD92_17890 [Massilia sp. Root1485]
MMVNDREKRHPHRIGQYVAVEAKTDDAFTRRHFTESFLIVARIYRLDVTSGFKRVGQILFYFRLKKDQLDGNLLLLNGPYLFNKAIEQERPLALRFTKNWSIKIFCVNYSYLCLRDTFFEIRRNVHLRNRIDLDVNEIGIDSTITYQTVVRSMVAYRDFLDVIVEIIRDSIPCCWSFKRSGTNAIKQGSLPQKAG